MSLLVVSWSFSVSLSFRIPLFAAPTKLSLFLDSKLHDYATLPSKSIPLKYPIEIVDIRKYLAYCSNEKTPGEHN